MAKKEVAALLEQKQPQAKNHTHSLHQITGIVNPLAQLRQEKKLAVRDMVDCVRKVYPKYDKVLQSKAEHGEEYGIDLRSDAMHALLAQFAPERLRRPQQPRRTKPYRISARLDERLFGLLQQAKQRSGKTMQDFLEMIVADYLKMKGEEHDPSAQ